MFLKHLALKRMGKQMLLRLTKVVLVLRWDFQSIQMPWYHCQISPIHSKVGGAINCTTSIERRSHWWLKPLKFRSLQTLSCSKISLRSPTFELVQLIHLSQYSLVFSTAKVLFLLWCFRSNPFGFASGLDLSCQTKCD